MNTTYVIQLECRPLKVVDKSTPDGTTLQKKLHNGYEKCFNTKNISKKEFKKF